MSSNKPPSGSGRLDEILAEVRRKREEKEKSYRGMALKLFPPICARCGREFECKRLKELTVHHKDHNHDNNPPDGSNWELLCLYCHDNEHSRDSVADWYAGASGGSEAAGPSLTHKPFSGLEALLKNNAAKGGVKG